jgi:hypothetical protein
MTSEVKLEIWAVALLVTLLEKLRDSRFQLLIDLRELVSLSESGKLPRLNLNLTWQTRSPASVRSFRHVLNSFLSLLTLFAVLATDFASSSPLSEPGQVRRWMAFLVALVA